MNFFDKLNAAIDRNRSLLCLGLDPDPETLPNYNYEEGDKSKLINDLWDWWKFQIAQTVNLVCAYKPTLGFYQALGAPGLELLQKTLSLIPDHIPIILDAKHSDLASSSVFAETIFADWGVDAVTLNIYAGQELVAPFLVYPNKAVFIVCCTANPSGAVFQEYPTTTAPVYLQVVKEAKTLAPPEELGLEVGTTKPEILARIRAIAPERLILVRGIWNKGGDLSKTLEAGLNSQGDGLIIPIPQYLLTSDRSGKEIELLRDEINQERTRLAVEGSSCDLWLPDLCLLNGSPHLDLILQLYDLGCIMFGSYVQASGAIFPYYIDLRKIISHPQIFHQVVSAYAEILKNLEFDRIAGIPYGALPTATGLALRLDRPMIFPRKEIKAHGTRRAIEGHFHAGETVVVVDDIMISGNSVMEGAEKIKSVGLNVRDIVVFIDHEKGVKGKLEQNGYCSHSVLTMSEIAQTLYESGRLNEQQFQLLGSHN